MMASQPRIVPFVGGPYDGCDELPGAQIELYDRIEMPVSVNILRLMNDVRAGRQTTIRSIAVYQLVPTARGRMFHFMGLRRPGREEAAELAEWHREVLAGWSEKDGGES